MSTPTNGTLFVLLENSSPSLLVWSQSVSWGIHSCSQSNLHQIPRQFWNWAFCACANLPIIKTFSTTFRINKNASPTTALSLLLNTCLYSFLHSIFNLPRSLHWNVLSTAPNGIQVAIADAQYSVLFKRALGSSQHLHATFSSIGFCDIHSLYNPPVLISVPVVGWLAPQIHSLLLQ